LFPPLPLLLLFALLIHTFPLSLLLLLSLLHALGDDILEEYMETMLR